MREIQILDGKKRQSTRTAHIKNSIEDHKAHILEQHISLNQNERLFMGGLIYIVRLNF